MSKPSETVINHSQIARKRIRIAAFFFDFMIYSFVSMVVGFFFGEPMKNEFGYTISGFPALGLFLVALFLWPISEAIWGQTIGKRVFELKVLSENFKSIGTKQAFIRFYVGLADNLFFLGLFVASNNDKNQRIGDIVAKTIVVEKT